MIHNCEGKAEVVGIADIFKPPPVWISWVDRGKLLHPFSHFEGSLLLPLSKQHPCLPLEGSVCWVELPCLPLSILGNEHGFDKSVQFVEQDIGEDRTHHAPHNVANSAYFF